MNRVSKIITVQNSSGFKKKALQWAQQFEEVVYLESNSDFQISKQQYKDYDAVLALGAQKSLSTSYNNAFQKLKQFQNQSQDFIFGHLNYDLKNDIEELSSSHDDEIEFPDLYFFQPKKIFLWRDNQLDVRYLRDYEKEIELDLKTINEYSLCKRSGSQDPDIRKKISKKSYFKKVANILEHIHRGDIYEVNFCQEFYANNVLIDPVLVYQKLNDISHAPFASFVKMQDKFLLCSSPERFAKKQDNKIIVQPIKGTARRIEDTEQDQLLAKNLSNDPKERAENIMIVDLIRNDLSKSATKGSVKVEELCEVYSFKQVHQLISTVSSESNKNIHAVDIIKDLFPMGSMTGAPKISAMKIIEEEEETKRGLYSGAVGYFSPEGDFDFNVVIRSILYNASNKYASFSVGSAITSLSVIENEYEECLLKAKALKEALKN
ncbi:MAG: anthranilate synthase component I family protein [Flavobacteriales bacterium]|nr:anthranilate synthase component I family protein [Flavobacteriales bacterium]